MGPLVKFSAHIACVVVVFLFLTRTALSAFWKYDIKIRLFSRTVEKGWKEDEQLNLSFKTLFQFNTGF